MRCRWIGKHDGACARNGVRGDGLRGEWLRIEQGCEHSEKSSVAESLEESRERTLEEDLRSEREKGEG